MANKEYVKEMQRVSTLIGEEVTQDTLNKSVSTALAKLMREGMPKSHIERMLKSARPLGDFAYFQDRMSFDDFNAFFGGPVRKYGLDGSLEHKYGCYGASTVPEILNISPYRCNVDTYEAMRGRKFKDDPEKLEIFYAGHMIEPVYRNYFRHMYGNRYIVFDCDIQWASRTYDHFIGNCDGLLYDKETGQLGILEIKHTSQNNMKTIKAVQSGDTPKYWDLQQRCYMELLDADFSCIFLGWGNRPGLETNAMHRIERDRDFGESILEQTEDFMTGNVEAGIKPSYKNVKSYERVKESIEEIYGPVNPTKKTVTLGKSFKKNLEALRDAQAAIEVAKAAEKQAKEAVEEAQRRYEELQLPIIEELKTAPKGEFIDEDGTHYDVSYDVRNALDVEKVRDLYPAAYDTCNKPAVDTKTLKRLYPEIYRECFGPKVGGKRTFDLNIWKRGV